jgi:serpin B
MVVSRREFLAGLGMVMAAGAVGWAAEKPAVPNKSDLAVVVKGNNTFAFDLYAELRKKEGNLFLSPNSISTALAMTYAGARGETASQMATVLHLPFEPDRLNPAFAGLVKDLQSGAKPRGRDRKPAYQLNIANALWGQKGYHFREEFVSALNADYGAGFEEVDFRNAADEARQVINKWVEKRTQDKIKELFKPRTIDSSYRLVLTNAIYFKAAWALPFSKRLTKDEDFHTSAAKKVSVPMMHEQQHFAYFESDKAQVLELPYVEGALSMLVMLPRKVDGLADLEASLSQDNLKNWLAQMQHREVKVSLPKFKVTKEFELKDVLGKLGMPLAFEPFKADFSGMDGTRELFIGTVVHQAYVDVNEEGTEAAAATGVGMKLAAAPIPEEIPVFRADHPFVFLIRDAKTQSILFMGRVVNPK